jgi:hypothetical protein
VNAALCVCESHRLRMLHWLMCRCCLGMCDAQKWLLLAARSPAAIQAASKLHRQVQASLAARSMLFASALRCCTIVCRRLTLGCEACRRHASSPSGRSRSLACRAGLDPRLPSSAPRPGSCYAACRHRWLATCDAIAMVSMTVGLVDCGTVSYRYWSLWIGLGKSVWCVASCCNACVSKEAAARQC